MLLKVKNSWKFVDILARQCRSPFNLTNIYFHLKILIFDFDVKNSFNRKVISTAWLQCKQTFDFCDLKSLFTFWLSSSLFRNPFNLTNFLTRYLKILTFRDFEAFLLLSYNVNKLSRFSWLWFCNNWQQKSRKFVYIFLQRPSDNFWTGICNGSY